MKFTCNPVKNEANIRKRMPVNKKNSAAKHSEGIDWNVVDALPLADSPDDDSPELTAAEFAELRPLAEVLPSLGIGKQRITIMLDESVIRAYKAKAGGRGYQTLINDTLRRALETDSIKEALRDVIREELRPS